MDTRAAEKLSDPVSVRIAICALAVVASMAARPTPIARAEDPPATAPAKTGRVVEEIIVTAQRKEEHIHDVPISLSVLDSEFLAQQNVIDFKDVIHTVPNARIDNSGEFNDVRIRGFGSPLSNKAFEQSVGLVIDGVPYGRREYFLGPLFDLERVEVLRGPQGTLFGRNTTAGLFNVITKKPTDELTGFANGEYGELSRVHFSGGVGGPIIRNFLNFRLSGLAEKRDGFIENTTTATCAAISPEGRSTGRRSGRSTSPRPCVSRSSGPPASIW